LIAVKEGILLPVPDVPKPTLIELVQEKVTPVDGLKKLMAELVLP
jgi:hypothetical protein